MNRLRVPTPLTDSTEELIHRVIGCGIAVHTELRAGLPERAYSRAMCLELDAARIAYERERLVRVVYRERTVCECRLDLVVDGALIVEVKAVERLLALHHAQMIGYLRASGLRAGLLMNFNVALLPDGLKRIVL
jgi:GxxExxY protein